MRFAVRRESFRLEELNFPPGVVILEGVSMSVGWRSA